MDLDRLFFHPFRMYSAFHKFFRRGREWEALCWHAPRGACKPEKGLQTFFFLQLGSAGRYTVLPSREWRFVRKNKYFPRPQTQRKKK